jgi:TatD DNase family protein
MQSSSRLSALVDAHCHIDLFPKPAEIIAAVDRAHVHTIAVTNAPFVFKNTLDLSKLSSYVHPALGLHPELVHSHGNQVDQLISLLDQTRFIGEVGLDFMTPDRSLRQRQSDIFNRVLAECRPFQDKVITVHSRRASREVVAAVGPNYPGAVILHWFSGSLSDVRKATSYGLWFSVNIAMTQSTNGLAILAELPRDRVLTETDGPFVKPDGVPQQPADAKNVLPVLAELWDVDEAEAQSTVLNNFATATQIEELCRN